VFEGEAPPSSVTVATTTAALVSLEVVAPITPVFEVVLESVVVVCVPPVAKKLVETVVEEVVLTLEVVFSGIGRELLVVVVFSERDVVTLVVFSLIGCVVVERIGRVVVFSGTGIVVVGFPGITVVFSPAGMVDVGVTWRTVVFSPTAREDVVEASTVI